MTDTDYGPLAAALAKAQSQFPAITRDREVEVQKKAGGSYKFKYAPLDSILAAVRKPLSDNGLAIVQLLDDDTLVTSLLHESGAIISGRTPIPAAEGVQAYGSAITYLRRYSIQALLGIAAEEDDDGNQAVGNRATFSGKREPRPVADGRGFLEPPGMTREQAQSLANATEPVLVGPWTGTGKVVIRRTGPADGERRDGPEGTFRIVGFATVDDQTLPQVLIKGGLAEDIFDAANGHLADLVGTISGDLYRVPWNKEGKPMPPFQRLNLTRFEGPGWTLPEPTQSGPGLFDADTEAELDAAIP